MITLHQGDALEYLSQLPAGSVQCCVTSPPYFGLRDYGHDGQIGLEPTPEAYVARLVEVFREVRRVLRDDGTLWLNLGDSYARTGGEKGGGNRELLHMEGKQVRMCKLPTGIKEKDLIGIPWRVAFALQADGWYLRQDIIWHKPAPMPESVRDRCTKAHEYLFLLTKSARYYWDHQANQEQAVGGYKGSESHTGKTGQHQLGRASKKPRVNGGACFGKQLQNADGTLAQQRQYDRPVYHTRNRRSVWTVASQPFKGAHFAVMPEKLVEPCVLVSSRPGDTILDPFAGSGTTLAVAQRLGRQSIGIELSPAYCNIIRERIGAA